jgi:hypothetical protein
MLPDDPLPGVPMLPDPVPVPRPLDEPVLPGVPMLPDPNPDPLVGGPGLVPVEPGTLPAPPCVVPPAAPGFMPPCPIADPPPAPPGEGPPPTWACTTPPVKSNIPPTTNAHVWRLPMFIVFLFMVLLLDEGKLAGARKSFTCQRRCKRQTFLLLGTIGFVG